MNTNTSKKNQYFAPTVDCIQFDNEISLALLSDSGLPPVYEQLLNDDSPLVSNQTFDAL